MANMLPYHHITTNIIIMMMITWCMCGCVIFTTASSLLDGLHSWSITRPAVAHDMRQQSNDDGSVLHYTVSAYEHEYQIRLIRATDLFHQNYEELLIGSAGEVLQRRSGDQVETACYYRGHVVGVGGSSVTMSTCTADNDRSRQPATSSTHHLASKYQRFHAAAASSSPNGNSAPSISLTGVISIPGESPLFIEPAGDHASRLQSYSVGDHIIYRGVDMINPERGECGVKDHYHTEAHNDNHHHDATTSSPTPSSSSRSSSPVFPTRTLLSSNGAAHTHSTSRFTTLANGNAQKYVELYVINDYKRYAVRGDSTPHLSKQIINQVAALYTNAWAQRFEYKIQVQIVGMATFSISDPYAAPTASSSTEIDHADLLTKFSVWTTDATAAGTLPAHDNAHLLSGYDFTGGTVGYAGVGAMCDSSTSTGITQATGDNPIQTAATTAHEMGHNFGMRHDNQYGSIAAVTQTFMTQWCNTADYSYHIMADVSVASIIPYIWSNCSQLYIDDWIDNGGSSPSKYGGSSRPMCLENYDSSRTWSNATAVCGDGIRQTGEQCDCGLLNCTTVDPCCNGATCQLLAGSACSKMDPCCTSSCQIATDGRICRASVHADCDYADQCDGIVATCPANYYAAAGTACSWNITGYGTGTGVCYATQCLSHKQQCGVIDTLQPSWNLVTVCNTYGDTSGTTPGCSQSLTCSEDPTGASLCTNDYDFGSGKVYPADGTPCNSGMQCYNKVCVSSSSLPSPITDAVWKLGNWSTCSHPCGGTWTRTVICKRGNTTVPDSWCVQPAPSTSSACTDATACSARVAWNITSSWSACSTTCKGISTRTVVCADTISIGTTWADSSCTSTKPATSQICNSNANCTQSSSSSSSSSTGSGTGQYQTQSSTGDALDSVTSTLNTKLVGDFTVTHLLIVIAGILVSLCLCALVRSCCCSPERARVRDVNYGRKTTY